MSQYLSIKDAMTIIGAACGRTDFDATSHGESWALFNLPLKPAADPSAYLQVGIEKIDFPEELDLNGPGFESDDEALEHVNRIASQGGDMHAQAERIHHAADSLRYHIWGEAWVNSRLGPPTLERV